MFKEGLVDFSDHDMKRRVLLKDNCSTPSRSFSHFPFYQEAAAFWPAYTRIQSKTV